jgi:hypothetical protein
LQAIAGKSSPALWHATCIQISVLSNSTCDTVTIMSTTHWTDAPAHSRLPAQPDVSRFSDAQWRELLDDDRFAFSTVSLLLAAIIGLGMLGMAVVVGILAFGG